MIKNYFKIAFRNLRRQKMYSFINIAGLAVGMACCFLILLHVRDELSYDRYHKNAGRIYRLEVRNSAKAPAPWSEVLISDYPDILNAVRFHHPFGGSELLIEYKDKHFYENRFLFADASVFNVFTFPLVQGDSQTALSDPYTVVLTKTAAQKYFGNADPVGKSLMLNWRGEKYPLKITGVLQQIPDNSHFQFDFLASFISLKELWNYRPVNLFEHWGNSSCYTYLLVSENFSPVELERQYSQFREKYLLDGPWRFYEYRYTLRPLTDIHLHSHVAEEVEPNSDIAYIYIFSAIALFILLIACINYMNLATARFAGRAKEVGVRKVFGAFRWQLIKLFLGESLLFSLLAFSVAIACLELVLPLFNTFAGKELQIAYSQHASLLWMFTGIAFLVGIVAGVYPALFLSAFHPAQVLKGHLKSGAKSPLFRRAVIVFQFVISLVLIIGAGIIHQQLEYMKDKRLGFKKEQVLTIPMWDIPLQQKYGMIKTELQQHPNIIRVSASNSVPGRQYNQVGIAAEGISPDEGRTMFMQAVDHDFIPTFGMEIAAGRNFSSEISTDSSQGFILNEAAIRKLGWESPETAIGKEFIGFSARGSVIGVVKDYHFQSFHHEIAPLIMDIYPRFYRVISCRIRPENMAETLTFLKAKWLELFPGRPFRYFFLDDDFDQLFRAEERLQTIIGYFTLLAIFIACLGLFGLTSFITVQRTKEIGIRKVLGATISNVVLLLSKDFLILVGIAYICATPVAYIAMNRWLQDFAYRIDIGIGIFLRAGVLAIFIVFSTISYQAIKAALVNPADCIRYE